MKERILKLGGIEYTAWKPCENFHDVFLFVGFRDRRRNLLEVGFFRIAESEEGFPMFISEDDGGREMSFREWSCTPIPECYTKFKYALCSEILNGVFMPEQTIEVKREAERAHRLRGANMLANMPTVYGGELE